MALKLINNKGQYRTSTPNELRLAGKNTWKGWLCSVGINAMHIDLSGDVWGATCRVGGQIGSIYDSPFKILDVPLWTKCTKDMCGCTADIRLPKVKEDIYFDLLRCAGDYTNSLIDYQALNWEENRVHISWDLGQRCNYECTYCPPYLHDKTSPHLPFDKVIEILDVILEYYDNRLTEFNFAGGEPTIHPQFMEIAKYLKERGSSIIITTNGSRSTKYLIELSQYLNLMIISHHFEYIKLDKMADKIHQLIESSNSTKFLLRLMMKPGLVYEIYDYAQSYRKYIDQDLVYFEFTPIRQQKPFRDLISDEYTEDELTVMAEIQRTFLGS